MVAHISEKNKQGQADQKSVELSIISEELPRKPHLFLDVDIEEGT